MKSTDYRANVVNQEALDDPNYRPYTEPGELPLYNLMVNNAENPTSIDVPLGNSVVTIQAEPAVEEFVTEIQSWPIYNIDKTYDIVKYQSTNGIPPWVTTATPSNPLGLSPYNGVIMNPRRCEVEAVDSVTSINTKISPYLGSDASIWNNANIPTILNDIPNKMNEACKPLLEHTDRMLSNLPSIMGIVQGALALASALSLLSNPCSPLADFMGSLMDKGKQLTKGITDAIDEVNLQVDSYIQTAEDEVNGAVKDAIGPIISSINSIVSDIDNLAGEITNMVTEEIQNIAKAMLDQARQGLAGLIASLPDDPCLRSLGVSVLTGGAAALIG